MTFDNEAAVDQTKPLDEDTRQRLLERNRWQEVEENDRLFPEGQPDSEGGDPASPDEPSTGADGAGTDDSQSDNPDDGGGEQDEDEDPGTKQDLRDELDRLEVDWKTSDNKATLIEKVRQAHEAGA